MIEKIWEGRVIRPPSPKYVTEIVGVAKLGLAYACEFVCAVPDCAFVTV